MNESLVAVAIDFGVQMMLWKDWLEMLLTLRKSDVLIMKISTLSGLNVTHP